jgi:hypothetical protein
MMKIAENKIRPVSVMKEPTDARSFQSVVFNALAVCDLCDEVEIELLAISDLLWDFWSEPLSIPKQMLRRHLWLL